MRTVCAVLAAAALACASAASVSHSPALRAAYTRLTSSPDGTMVSFTASMPMNNMDKLESVLNAVSDPKSPHYGNYLSMEELDQMTAPDAATVAAVNTFFTSRGATCEIASSEALACHASAKTVRSLFNTNLYTFQHKETGRVVHKVEGDFTFPAELEGKVNFVSGLAQLPVPKYGQVRTEAATPGSPLAVVPETLTNLYNINIKGSDASTQSAIEFQSLGSYNPGDLSKFVANTGIANFTIANTQGPFTPNSPAAESSLDVQYIGAVGEGNTNWYITSPSWMYSFASNIVGGKTTPSDVLSMSYGWSETDQCQISPQSKPCTAGGSQAFVEATNALFMKIGAAGHTLLAASGDSGAYGRSDGFCLGKKLNPAFPASSPYLTAVGATQLATASSTGATEPICQSKLQCATSGTEVVCSKARGALITSGGGFSEYADQPSYQSAVVAKYLATAGVTPPTTAFNAKGRGYPDIAALGHKYYIQLQGFVQSVDGTSASCPVTAGALALINAYRAENGKAKLGFANPWLYSLYASDPTITNDITEGDNKCTEQACYCKFGYTATAGWDAATGLGTPNVAKIISAMQDVEGLAPPSANLMRGVATTGNALRGAVAMA